MIYTSSSQVTLLDGNSRANVTVNNTLVPNRKYYVLIEDGAFVAFEDCAGLRSPVAGISDKNIWTFTAGEWDRIHERLSVESVRSSFCVRLEVHVTVLRIRLFIHFRVMYNIRFSV